MPRNAVDAYIMPCIVSLQLYDPPVNTQVSPHELIRLEHF